MGGGSGQRGATIGQLQAATDGNCDRMRQILRDPSLAPRKREGYINAMRNLGCDTAVMTTVAMGAAGGAFGGLGHGLAITANAWTFGLISPLDSHAEGLQDAYGHLAEYRMAAGAAEIGREAAIAALTGGAGNVALKAGRWAAAARGVYAAGQVYNGVQVGQGLYAAAGAFAQGNVLQGVLLGVTSGVGLPAKGAIPELRISASKYPELAENIRHAQAAGHPSVLTHGGSSTANRSAALRGHPTVPGMSRDEYPFASSLQGGGGSWVGQVPVRQQQAQGGLIRAMNLKPGDAYRVVIEP